MDPIVLLVVVIVIAAILYFFYRRGNQPPEPPSDKPREQTNPDTQTFEFFPSGSDQGIGRVVTRHVKLVAPPQKSHGVVVNTQVIGPEPSDKPPQGKGIDDLIVTVLNPHVTDSETKDVLTDFDPPLTITIDYTEDDSSRAGYAGEGTPALSIVLYYVDGGQTFWERLRTEVNGGKTGTLTADIKTLRPQDPVAIGHP